MSGRGTVLILAVLTSAVPLFGCSESETTSYKCGSNKAPTPMVSAGGDEVKASWETTACDTEGGSISGHGEAFAGRRAVVDATDDVVITVPESLTMEADWRGAAFVEEDDGVYRAPLPSDGCHLLRITLGIPDTEDVWVYAVDVSVGGADCSPPPKVEGFRLLGMTPTTVVSPVGVTTETDVVIHVANPPDGFFCPAAAQVSGVILDEIDFPLGCTHSGTGDAMLSVKGSTVGEAVIEVSALASDGTAAAGSSQVTVTVVVP